MVEDIMGLDNLAKKWEAFGFNTIVIEDGHDVEAILNAIESAKKENEKPSMIILNTIKGKGVKLAEDAGVGNHNMPISAEQKEQILAELK